MDGGGGFVGLFLEDPRSEDFLTCGGFGTKIGLERSPEVVAEPGRKRGIDDVAQYGFGMSRAERVGFPGRIIGGHTASGRLVGEFDEVANEMVDAVLVAKEIGGAVMLESVEEFADDFVQEFRAITEVEVDSFAAGFEQNVVEATEVHVNLVICEHVGPGAMTERLADGITNSEAANSVGMAFVEPDFNQVVETEFVTGVVGSGFAVENSLVDIEVGLADFDGAIVVKGLVHAKTSFVRFAAFGGLSGDS